jgi:hypothetical protein
MLNHAWKVSFWKTGSGTVFWPFGIKKTLGFGPKSTDFNQFLANLKPFLTKNAKKLQKRIFQGVNL